MVAPDNAYAVILAGGGGTRLWPISRSNYPKHIQSFFGDETMIQTTFNRIKPLIPPQRVFIITNSRHLDLAKQQLPEIPPENFIAEPIAKNTALAMGTAAVFVHKRSPNAPIIYLAADHLIKDEEKFRKVAAVSLHTAISNGFIVSIGIKPTFAHTGLGYIRIGKQLDLPGDDESEIFVFEGKGFKEKPDLATAQAFLASGEYFWNANIYSWTTRTILKAFEKYAPAMRQTLENIYNSLETPSQDEVIAQEYDRAENAQIDYMISEKADNIVLIPGVFGWSDVGDWQTVFEESTKDQNKNVIIGQEEKVLAISSHNSLFHTNKRLIAAVDLDNYVVIDTEDVLLICPKEKSQDVKKAVEQLKTQNKNEYL